MKSGNYFRKMKTTRLKLPKSLADWFYQASICILLLNLLTGCLANFGGYSRDADVFQVFNTDQVPLDYRYYYYHSGSEPIAVIGVEKKYDAGSRMWRDIEPDTEEFREMIRWIWEDFGYTRFGARINDPSGNQVGIMYTSIREVAIKFTDNNRIMVMPHTPFLWGEVDNTGEDYASTDSNPTPSNQQMAFRH